MKVAYAVPHPVSGALYQRILGIVRSLRLAKPPLDVTVIAPSLEVTAESQEHLKFRAAEEVPLQAGAASKVLRRVRLGRETVRELETFNPDLVIIYGGGSLYMGRIQSWARGRDCTVVADAVEWYEAAHQPGGKWGPFALDNELMMRRTLMKCDGVIAISTFLANHVAAKSDMPVVVVPPALDTSEVAWSTSRTMRQRLVYCGNPGRKDNLGVVINALAQVDPEGHCFELLVAGPDEAQVSQLPYVREVPASVSVLGRLSNAESLALMTSATWAPLVRPDQRYAHAGFPTKIVEALAVGTPPIANITSDLGAYLVDGENALLLADDTLESMIDALRRAAAVPPPEVERMSQMARSTAERSFDLRGYSVRLGVWLDEIAQRRVS